MSVAPYFKTITSESAFNSRYAAERAQPFAEVQGTPASKWGRNDLFACRVVRRQPQRDSLPLLERFELTPPVAFRREVRQFIEGPQQEHMSWSELGLVRRYGLSLGQVWAGLAMFLGPEERRRPIVTESEGSDSGSVSEGTDTESEADLIGRRKRLRRNTQQLEFADSSVMRVGSSSPLADGSQGTSSMGYIDLESHMLASQPEDETLHFICCAARHMLYFSPPQEQPDIAAMVEVRDAKVRLAVTTPVLSRLLVAVDDGGLCLRRRVGPMFKTLRNRVVMFETKGTFRCLESGRPTVSDDCFAQMTCQALTARLADPQRELKRGHVLVMHAAQHYVCFLQFDISDEYLADVELPSPKTFMYVWSTPWYDLSSRDGRSHFVRVMCSIMKYAVTT